MSFLQDYFQDSYLNAISIINSQIILDKKHGSQRREDKDNSHTVRSVLQKYSKKREIMTYLSCSRVLWSRLRRGFPVRSSS